MKQLGWIAVLGFLFLMGTLLYGLSLSEIEQRYNENPEDPYITYLLGRQLGLQSTEQEVRQGIQRLEEAQAAGFNNYSVLLAMGQSYQRLGEYQQAAHYFQEALSYRDEDYELLSLIKIMEAKDELEQDNDNIEALYHLSQAYFEIGSFEASLTILQRILSLSPRHSDALNLKSQLDKAERGLNYFELAQNLSQEGLFATAEENFRFAARLFSQINHDFYLCLIYNSYGNSRYKNGDYTEALSYYNRSFETAISIHYYTGMLDSLGNMGNIHFITGNYNQAEEHYNRCIEYYERDGLLTSAARIAGNLSSVYAAIGNYDRALDILSDSLQPLELSGNKDLLGNTYANIGIILYEKGIYQEAFDYLYRANNLFEEENNNSSLVLSLSNTGELYQSLGKYEEAADYFERSLRLANDLNLDAFRFAPLGNMGINLISQGRVAEGIEKLRRAAQIARNLGNRRAHAFYLSKLAAAYIDTNRFTEATNALLEALEIARDTGNIPVQTSVALSIADIYLQNNQVTDARRYYDIAYELSMETKISQLLYQVYFGKGECDLAENNIDEAITNYKQSVSVLEEMKRHIGGVENDIEDFLSVDNRMRVYERLVELLTEQGKEVEAFEYLQRSKQSLEDQSLGYFRPETEDQAANNLLDRYEEARLKIEQLDQELTNSNSALQSRELIQMRQQAQEAMDGVLSSLNLEFPEIANQLSFQTVEDYSRIQQFLSDQDCVLSYCLTEKKMMVFIITKERFEIIETEVDKKDIVMEVSSFRQCVDVQSRAELRDFYPDMRRSLKQLYGYLITPLEDKIDGYNNLRIVPYGVLYFLPFHALIKTKNNGEELFLIEWKNISYFSSTDFIALAADNQTNQSQSILAIGNPTTQRADLLDLPGAENEVSIIKQIFPGTMVLIREEATKERLLEKVEDHTILHIAAHGILNTDARRSYIALAGIRGGLYIREIKTEVHFSDDMDLVVLSACNSGVSNFSEDTSGAQYISIASAFLEKVPTLIATLWPLSDVSAPIMIEDFYSNLKNGTNKDTALRQAMISLLSRQEYENPFYWAPFIITGNFN